MQSPDIKDNYLPRLLGIYGSQIVPTMKDKFGYKNTLAVPRLIKIVVNMGVGEAGNNSKIVDKLAIDLEIITGQRPRITRARKAISNFKIRKGMVIGDRKSVV